MSITYKGVLNGPYQSSRDGGVTSSRVLVFYFNAAESAVEVAQQTEIPDTGTAHPDDAALLLSDISISEPKEGDGIKSGKYEVTLNYVRPASGQANTVQDKSVAPWERPPFDISVSPKEVVQAFVKAYDTGDVNGTPTKPVLNPAGDPYEDSTATQNTALRFSYYLEDFYPYWSELYSDTINADDIQVCDIGVPAKRGLLRGLSFAPQREYDAEGALLYEFVRVDAEIEISKREWSREILARGLYYLDGTNKIRIHVSQSGATYGAPADCGDKPIPVDEPQKLTAAGALYPATATGGYYQTFNDKFAANWGPMGFPTTIAED